MSQAARTRQAYQSSSWATTPDQFHDTPGRAARKEWNARAKALKDLPILEEAVTILSAELESAMARVGPDSGRAVQLRKALTNAYADLRAARRVLDGSRS